MCAMNPKIEHILHIIRTISIILCIIAFIAAVIFMMAGIIMLTRHEINDMMEYAFIAGIVAAFNMLIIAIMNTIIN